MDLKNYPRKDYAINQFSQPHVTELKGKDFRFIMDGGYDYEIHITGDDVLEWNVVGGERREAKYECLKGDDTTYLLDYDIADTIMTDHAENHCYIIDLEQRLVTRMRCYMGWNPKFPYLIKTEYDFGAIETEGKQLPMRRHSFTSDLIGTRVQWHWNYTMWTHHNYYSSDYYTLTWDRESDAVNKIEPPFTLMPCHDDCVRFIKIKENMYVFHLVEEMMERCFNGGPGTPFRSNNMIFLQNWERMYHVGRTFGHIMIDGKVNPCRTLFGSFGNPVEIPEDVLYEDNAYIV